jgi:hypothetical protein
VVLSIAEMRLYPIAFCLVLFSCTDAEQVPSLAVEADSITPTDSFSINTSDIPPMYSFYFDDDDQEYLAAYHYGGDIALHDIPGGKLVEKINLNAFDSTGNKLVQFYIHNRDSVFILTANTNLVYCINFAGIINNHWYFDAPFGQNDDYLITSHYDYPLLYQDGKLYVSQSPELDSLGFDSTSWHEFFSYPPCVSLNLKDSLPLPKNLAPYPDSYRKGSLYYSFLPAYTVNEDGQVIVSYQPKDELFVYDENGLVLKKKTNASHWRAPTPFQANNFFDYEYIERYLCTESRYSKILYDKYKDQYYRVLQHASEYINEDGTLNTWIDKPWSILVLDRNFDLIQEFVFPPKMYDFRLIHVTRDGLLLSTNHKLNPNYDHSKSRFALFNL